MSKFQIILLGAFGVFIVIAVGVFALYRGGNSGATGDATVTLWGDIPAESLGFVLDNAVSKVDKNLKIKYVEKNPVTIDQEFTEALASGQGPDLIITTQEKLWKNRAKLVPIPYDNISQRDFKNTFIEEGELFLMNAGIYALPLSVDPIVLYYNRDLLSTAGEAKPIEYWDQIYPLTQKLTKRDAAGNVVQSVIAMGDTRNIPNFKEIVSLLMLQAGSPITGYVNSALKSFLSAKMELPVNPGDAALEFYTQFSNPSKAYYSWNRTQTDAQTNFTSGDSAFYLGFASELKAIKNKNPNLNFDIAPVPQSRVSGKSVTYGNLRAVAITRGTTSTANALRAALVLISKDISTPLSAALNLPPARRDLLTEKQKDAYMSVFYISALQSKGWIDPDADGTKEVFRKMVESVTSGRARTLEAVNAANNEIDNLIK